MAVVGGKADPARYIALAAALAVAMGLLLFLAGPLRLGFIASTSPRVYQTSASLHLREARRSSSRYSRCAAVRPARNAACRRRAAAGSRMPPEHAASHAQSRRRFLSGG